MSPICLHLFKNAVVNAPKMHREHLKWFDLLKRTKEVVFKQKDRYELVRAKYIISMLLQNH